MSESDFREDTMLFSETPGRFILSFSKDNQAEIEKRINDTIVPITGVGEVGGRNIVLTGAINSTIRLATAYKVWKGRLNAMIVLPQGVPQAVVPLPVPRV